MTPPADLAEEATLRAFLHRDRRDRWLGKIADPRRRGRIGLLRELCSCRDFDPRFVTPLPAGADVVAELVARGAPPTCQVMSGSSSLDGRTLPLAEAVAFIADFQPDGALLICLPGRLAYYCDEFGEKRWLLERAGV